ncbi:MAG: 4-(cytidine 5'-diphospho)-2-C-methyl-D-erythritol kinase [Chloroflexi bacterium]|nr:4-(cytidine 5'-diphospho)-2-C-methyl-D-erythritol kinase [Chloroflexota bacterium]
MSPSNAAGLRLLAPAKLNLALEVLGRRPDGFHDIDTVMSTIDLADQVELRVLPPGSGLAVSLTGDYAGGIDPHDDLSRRAAIRMAEAVGREPDLSIHVEKRIPSPAGLGGGSSDAAAVIRGLNHLWGLGWPMQRMEALAATLGSDVPFFLHGGAARCTGRGDVVEPLRDLTPLRLLVLVPPVPPSADKTARRYGALHPHDFSSGDRSKRLAARVARRAPPPTADLVNTFERVIERTEPELVAHYARYAQAGALRLHLCGAGPAVFLFIREDAKAQQLRRDFRAQGATVFETRTLGRAAATAATPVQA